MGRVVLPQTPVAQVLKALAHPVRIAILEILRTGEECVCHMEAMLGRRQAYISQQLMILRAAGIVQERRDGLNIFYRVVRPEVFAVIDAGRAMTGESAPITVLRESRSCPCPKCAAPVVVTLDTAPLSS